VETKSRLAGYAWRDPDNRVVFETLCQVRNANTPGPSELSEQLPAQATRLGFPDVNWENYLGYAASDQRYIRDLVDELLGGK
jgi:hypothetical protein